MKELYQQMIIDHSKNPKGMTDNPAGCCADGKNPLCGDQVKFCVTVEEQIITDVSYHAVGCSLSIAACSLLREAILHKPINVFEDLMSRYLAFIKTGEKEGIPKTFSVFKMLKTFPCVLSV